MPHSSQISLTLILEKGMAHISFFITSARAFLVILESAKASFLLWFHFRSVRIQYSKITELLQVGHFRGCVQKSNSFQICPMRPGMSFSYNAKNKGKKKNEGGFLWNCMD